MGNGGDLIPGVPISQALREELAQRGAVGGHVLSTPPHQRVQLVRGELARHGASPLEGALRPQKVGFVVLPRKPVVEDEGVPEALLGKA